MAAGAVWADEHTNGSPVASSNDEAWWTGSLLSASAATMPVGRLLFEPFVTDAMTEGLYDSSGTRHSAPRTDNVGTAAYIMYGLADGLSVGLLPHLALRQRSSAQGSSGFAPGDVTVMSQFRLTSFQQDGWMPATSLLLSETLPVGRYDRLAGGPEAGTGAGVYTTQVSAYAQTVLHAYRDRALRTRVNLTYAWSGGASLTDSSVYGTPVGFRGRVRPGAAITAVSAWEYSVTRNWVVALDLVYQHADDTHIAGSIPFREPADGTDGGIQAPQPVLMDSGPSASWSFAPALEYNFTGNIGIIAGAKFTGWGRNTGSVLVPAVAVNMFY